MADDYRGLLGAFVSAFRRSDSYLFRSYVATSALVGAFAAVFLLLALVFWLGTPAPLGQRALLGVIGVFVFLPLFAPVLVVARRHRRGVGRRRADALLGLTGFGFVLAVFLALFISDPNAHQVGGLGPLSPVFLTIDALPRSYWVVPPLLSVTSIVLAVRTTQTAGTDDGAGDVTTERDAGTGANEDREAREGADG